MLHAARRVLSCFALLWALAAPVGSTAAQDVPFLRGQVDQSGGIDMTDAIIILRYLFLGEWMPPCLDAADIDDSGFLNITDGILLLNYLFLGGAAPAQAEGGIISTARIGPIEVNAGEPLEIVAGGSVTSATDGVIVNTGGELILSGGSVSPDTDDAGVIVTGGIDLADPAVECLDRVADHIAAGLHAGLVCPHSAGLHRHRAPPRNDSTFPGR